ncbi:hypothetical protein LIA77_02778 [Sarocladium implicatum]|nr:hypothetical protein LIA77_02778 [Sarocladium implicatum]
MAKSGNTKPPGQRRECEAVKSSKRSRRLRKGDRRSTSLGARRFSDTSSGLRSVFPRMTHVAWLKLAWPGIALPQVPWDGLRSDHPYVWVTFLCLIPVLEKY